MDFFGIFRLVLSAGQLKNTNFVKGGKMKISEASAIIGVRHVLKENYLPNVPL